MSGQLHAPAALPPEKESPVPIEKDNEWAPEPVWMTRKKKILGPIVVIYGHFLN
jgi:hypothetical protein